MKRTAESDKPTDGPSSSGRTHAKRPKSSQACSSCRKHKTRCELLEGPSDGPYRCHRCKVLNISCSFESSDFAPPLQVRSPSPPPYLPHPRYGVEPPRIPPHTNSTVTSPNVVTPGSAATPAPVDENLIKLEDLFPLPPNAPWGLVKVPGGFDWTATPMLAMQNITTNRVTQSSDDSASADLRASLANILSPDNTKSLLHIFESKYSPWLNLQPEQGGSSMLLTLARCMVASRHLDPVTRAAVVPPLQKLTEDAVFRHVFTAIPSTQAIQAIMILSLWSPIGGQPHNQIRDGRLLVASAVSMAMNLRLSQAIEYVSELRGEIKEEESISTDVANDLEDGIEKARLWLALMNVEWMLCVGTGRSPLSHRTSLDYTVINWSSAATVGASRDMRLALTGQIFEVAEAGLRIHFSAKSDFDKFYKEVMGVLIKFDNLLRLVTPLSVIVEHELFYFHVLLIYHHICRLLVLHHCLRETRRVVCDDSGRPWHLMAELNGINLATQWGQEALLLAEGILAVTLSRPALQELGTAPDNVFAMLCFAASFLVMCKLTIHQHHGEHLPGSSDILLSKSIDLLIQSAYGPEHAPAKCAHLIRGLVASFDARTKQRIPVQSRSTSTVHCNMSSERTSLTRERNLHDSSSSTNEFAAGMDDQQPPHFDAPMIPMFGSSGDFGRLMNSEVMLDTDFWASFMDNLTTDVPYMEGVRAS